MISESSERMLRRCREIDTAERPPSLEPINNRNMNSILVGALIDIYLEIQCLVP